MDTVRGLCGVEVKSQMTSWFCRCRDAIGLRCPGRLRPRAAGVRLRTRIGVSLVLISLAVACAPPQDAMDLRAQFAANRTIDLQRTVPGPWTRVCILGPYSDNSTAHRTLGFAWPVERKSAIRTSDTITLLLFVGQDAVIRFIEHPRAAGDFSNLAGQCIAREQAHFTHLERPAIGWAGMFPTSRD